MNIFLESTVQDKKIQVKVAGSGLEINIHDSDKSMYGRSATTINTRSATRLSKVLNILLHSDMHVDVLSMYGFYAEKRGKYVILHLRHATGPYIEFTREQGDELLRMVDVMKETI